MGFDSGVAEVTSTTYTATRTGLPSLSLYFRDFWQRRHFAAELASSTLRSQQATTFFGQLWLVINPLLLSLVYYVLVIILSGGHSRGPDYFTHLISGLFGFYFVTGCLSGGASSVTGVGKLIMNQAFPRLLLPVTAVLVAIRRFVPTVFVFIVTSLILHRGFNVVQLLSVPAFLLLVMFGVGVASLFATLQVYFRDVASLLPYLSRIWLYVSPVLYYADQVPSAFARVMPANPLYGLMGVWTSVVARGEMPSLFLWTNALAWSVGSLLFGTYIFLIKERDFTVRL